MGLPHFALRLTGILRGGDGGRKHENGPPEHLTTTIQIKKFEILLFLPHEKSMTAVDLSDDLPTLIAAIPAEVSALPEHFGNGGVAKETRSRGCLWKMFVVDG